MSEQKVTCQTRKPYKTDLTDAQWALVEGLIPPAVPKPGCAPTNLREILNTILYQNRTSCQWDMLPHDLCARSTTFDYYQAWQDNNDPVRS
jgi:putative transposase